MFGLLWRKGKGKKKEKDRKARRNGKEKEPEEEAPTAQALRPDPDQEVEALVVGNGQEAQGERTGPVEPTPLEPVNPKEPEAPAEGEQKGDELLSIFAETEAERVSPYRGLRDSLPEVSVQDLRAELLRLRAVLRVRGRNPP